MHDEFGVKKDVIEYLPQYAEDIFKQSPAKVETGIFDIMFAGNIGAIQSIETVIKVAEILKDEPVKFHIVGDGTDFERIQRIAKNIRNVVFYGRQPIEEMPGLYSKADAMLVTLTADPVLSLTLPGKVQSYMSVGKPIIGAVDGETRKVIDAAQCGFCGKAGDAEELAENIRKFICKETNRKELGTNARNYYEENFQKKQFMDRLEIMLG